jgi:hypothetical protein
MYPSSAFPLLVLVVNLNSRLYWLSYYPSTSLIRNSFDLIDFVATSTAGGAVAGRPYAGSAMEMRRV